MRWEQHKRWRARVGTSLCCCRHNGFGLFALPLCLLALLLKVFACHAKIQHNDSCDRQTQWTGIFREIGCGAQGNRRYCSEWHICLAITWTSQHSINILPHVIALFCVCQGFCARTLQTDMKINPCLFVADTIHRLLKLFPSWCLTCATTRSQPLWKRRTL